MLTRIEFSVLSFVRDETRRNGFVPTLREIAPAVNVSYETVRTSLISLEQKGFVRRYPDKCRKLTILRMPEDGLSVA
ncbi:MAG: hypothetical protein WBX25_12610 [Rhodomicrobium sp.]